MGAGNIAATAYFMLNQQHATYNRQRNRQHSEANQQLGRHYSQKLQMTKQATTEKMSMPPTENDELAKESWHVVLAVCTASILVGLALLTTVWIAF